MDAGSGWRCASELICVPCAAGAWHGRGLVCYARSREGMGESGGRKAAYQSYSLEMQLAHAADDGLAGLLVGAQTASLRRVMSCMGPEVCGRSDS